MITLPSIEALDTHWWIEIFDNISREKAQTTYDGLRFTIKHFDEQYSHFRHKSTISNLNDSGFLLEPDHMTIDLLQYGLNLYHQTNGVFNFLVGETSEKKDYSTPYTFTPNDESVNIPDPTQVLSITQEKILLAHGHVDIGGYGKGYLIDMLAYELKNTYQISEFLINAGGDMYATTKDGQPVKIQLEHPTDSDVVLADTSLCNEGFAASTTSKRHLESIHMAHHHVVDSKTGESHNNALGIYIKAPKAAMADAWATTLLISSPANHALTLQKHSVKVATYNEQERKFNEWGKFF